MSSRQAPPDVVLAAGTVPWRLVAGELEVLLVHRPRYNDWSWPKGKVEPGEDLVVCAVRETIEETGLKVVAGVGLPPVSYKLSDGRSKLVAYWAARLATPADAAALRALGPVGPVDEREIDKQAWVPARCAGAWLSHPKDIGPLQSILGAFERGELDTRAVILLRHAKALSRGAWGAGEDTRPLVDSGKARAKALVPMLAAFGVGELVSSPWRRCLATLGPYSKRARLKVRTSRWITEDGCAKEPRRAASVIHKVVAGKVPAAICLHRPVLPVALKAVRSLARPSVIPSLPSDDPFLRTGEMLVLHTVGQNNHTKVVAVERQRPRLTPRP